MLHLFKNKRMNFTSVKELASKYDYFLFDCDGVLWHGENTQIGQAFKNIEWLESQGKKVFFVTNNASISRETMMQKMTNAVF
jgi:4-nitrophenyl phosphatase